MTHPGGRPTDYYEDVCEEVRQLMRNGHSITEVAYILDVDRSTIYEWADKHPKFSYALQKGREQYAGWWLLEGRNNLHNKEFNSGLWFMNMKNRHKWQDKIEQNTTVRLDETTQKAKDNLAEYEKPY